MQLRWLHSAVVAAIAVPANAFGVGKACTSTTVKSPARANAKLYTMQHYRRRSTALSAAPSSSSGSKGSAGGVLYFTGLSCATILISYADRSNLATAILPMSQQYDWSKSFEGTVLSAFFLGYALTQMLGGWLADKVITHAHTYRSAMYLVVADEL
jgi:Major Facilitator Superfamily